MTSVQKSQVHFNTFLNLPKESIYFLKRQLIVNPIAFFGNHLLATVRHGIYDPSALFFGNFIPRFSDPLPMFGHASWWPLVVPVEPVLEQGPHVLDRV